MANINKFENWYINQMAFIDAFEENAEHDYGTLCASTAGWASPGKIRLLDGALLCMEGDEEYLEIGTYTGRSLAGALMRNDKKAQVIDPFGLFLPDGDFIQGEWQKTIEAVGVLDRVTLHKTLCQSFQAHLPPIGVFYYDGNHDSGHTYEGLNKFKKYLSSRAIIIVDDYNIYGGYAQTPFQGHPVIIEKPVKADVDRWLNETKEASLIGITPWEHQSAVILYEN